MSGLVSKILGFTKQTKSEDQFAWVDRLCNDWKLAFDRLHKAFDELHKAFDELLQSHKNIINTKEQYEAAIRKHRDQKGDDRCWMDDEELYKILLEGYVPPERDSCVELEFCKKFIATRHNPGTSYISPERKIEELKLEIERLKQDMDEIEEMYNPRDFR